MSAAELPASTLLGDRYRLVERLGAGGMAVVWRGFDEVLGRQVAVKVLSAASGGDPGFRRRLRIEAQAAARLSHPHITGVYDYGESTTPDGTPIPYVVMELVDGESLAAVLARLGALPWPAAVRLCAEVAAALAAAHARGIVHRDIAPANVMLTVAGAKVVDFGISALVGENDIDPDGSLLGTPAYLAPERLDGGQVSAATDVYAVGLLLYRSLTGLLPWDAGTTTALLRAHQYTEPEPLPPIAGLPPEVADICRRSLSKQPAERPTSADLAAVFAQAALGAPATPLPLVTGAGEADGHTTILPWRVDAAALALTGPSGEIATPGAPDRRPAAAAAAPGSAGGPVPLAVAGIPAQRRGGTHGPSQSPAAVVAGGAAARSGAAPAARADEVPPPAQAAGGLAVPTPGGDTPLQASDGPVDVGVDGDAPDGSASNGAAMDGAAMDGAAMDGAAMDGAAMDGAAQMPGHPVAAARAGATTAASGPGRTGDEALTAVVGPARRRRRVALVAGVAAAAVAGGGYAWWVADRSAGGVDRVAAAPTAQPGTAAAPTEAACVVTYAIERDTGKAFRASVRVANRTAKAIDDWQLRFPMPGDQTVLGESPLATDQQGRNVLAASTEMIRPGGAVTVYLTGDYRSSNALPSTFTLNRMVCEVLLSAAPGEPPRRVDPDTSGVAAGVPDGVEAPVAPTNLVDVAGGDTGADTGGDTGGDADGDGRTDPPRGTGPSPTAGPGSPPPVPTGPPVDGSEDDDRGKNKDEKLKKAKKLLKKVGVTGTSPSPSPTS